MKALMCTIKVSLSTVIGLMCIESVDGCFMHNELVIFRGLVKIWTQGKLNFK